MAIKKLNDKHRKAIELLTCGKGLSYKQIAEEVGINYKTLWEWRNDPDYVIFQQELERVNNARWEAAVDAARAAAVKLCLEGKSDFVKFVLQNEGYNPTNKHQVDADVRTDIIIEIDEE